MAGRGAIAIGMALGVLLVTGGAAAYLAPPPRSSGPALPASGQGASTVTLSPDAQAHADGEAVRSLLQRHYDAINTRNYHGWVDTVVPERAATLDEPKWQQVYATTLDGNMRVDRIDPGATEASLLVRLRFVSVQDPAAAPERARAARLCWRSTLPLVGRPLRIGQTGDGSSLPQPC